jgi:hypothetical protein
MRVYITCPGDVRGGRGGEVRGQKTQPRRMMSMARRVKWSGWEMKRETSSQPNQEEMEVRRGQRNMDVYMSLCKKWVVLSFDLKVLFQCV